MTRNATATAVTGPGESRSVESRPSHVAQSSDPFTGPSRPQARQVIWSPLGSASNLNLESRARRNKRRAPLAAVLGYFFPPLLDGFSIGVRGAKGFATSGSVLGGFAP